MYDPIAINTEYLEYFTPPGFWRRDFSGLCKAQNPFSGMLTLKMLEHDGWEIIDMAEESRWPDNFDKYEDITNKLYDEYREKTGFRDEEGKFRTEGTVSVLEIITSETAISISIAGENNNYRIDCLCLDGDLMPETVRAFNVSRYIRKKKEEDDED